MFNNLIYMNTLYSIIAIFYYIYENFYNHIYKFEKAALSFLDSF